MGMFARWDADLPSRTYVDTAKQGGTIGTSVNFGGASFNFGPARGDRIMVALLGFSATAVESSVTIGGVAATLATGSRCVNSTTRTAIYAALVPSGTSGTLSFTSSASITDPSIQLFAAYGLTNVAAFAADQKPIRPNNMSLNAPGPGLVFGIGFTGVIATAVSWTGLTLDNTTSFNDGANILTTTCASLATTAALTGLSVSPGFSTGVSAASVASYN